MCVLEKSERVIDTAYITGLRKYATYEKVGRKRKPKKKIIIEASDANFSTSVKPFQRASESVFRTDIYIFKIVRPYIDVRGIRETTEYDTNERKTRWSWWKCSPESLVSAGTKLFRNSRRNYAVGDA